jgi:hypothetical protein
MVDTVSSQNIDLSSWNTLYSQVDKRRTTGMVYRNKLEGVQHGTVKRTLCWPVVVFVVVMVALLVEVMAIVVMEVSVY